MVPVTLRPLTVHFDALTISFYRMLAGTLVLLIFACVVHRGDLLLELHPKHIPWQLMLCSFLQVLGIAAWTQGTADTNATLSALAGVVQFPAVTFTALIFHPDERKGRHVFLTVLGIGFCSIAVFAYAGTQFVMPEGEHWIRGIICLGILTLSGYFAQFLLKSSLRMMKPLAVSVHSSAMFTVLLLLGACAWGHPGEIFHSSSENLVLLFASGALGTVAGVLFLSYLLHAAGLIPVQFALVCSPIAACFAAWLFLREVPSVSQFVWGSVMMAGCGLCMMPQRKMQKDNIAGNSIAREEVCLEIFPYKE